jgi:hypothetical protein
MPTTFECEHQGLGYLFEKELECDWFTYDWLDGKLVEGGDKCDGLAPKVYGGKAGVLATDCIPQSAWASTVAPNGQGGTCVTGVTKFSDLLKFDCRE